MAASRSGVLAAQLVGRRSWRRGQTAGGGSIPRWSTGKPQVVTRRKATGAVKKKVWLLPGQQAFGIGYSGCLEASEVPYSTGLWQLLLHW